MNADVTESLALRPYLPDDAPALAEIFRASIMELTGDSYSEDQQEAWASAADDEDAFAERLAARTVLVATLEGEPVGFAALQGNDRLEFLYVHPAAAGQGAGTMLCDAVERLAAGRGAHRIVADVSDSARGFFDRRGFVAQRRNIRQVHDEWLANTTMEKPLPARRSLS